MHKFRSSLKKLMLLTAVSGVVIALFAQMRLWSGTQIARSSMRIAFVNPLPANTTTDQSPHFTVAVVEFVNGGIIYCLDRSGKLGLPWSERRDGGIRLNGRAVHVAPKAREFWIGENEKGQQISGWENCSFDLERLDQYDYVQLDRIWKEVQEMRASQSASK